MRIIGVDIHRVFAEAVALEGASLRRPGRIGMTRDHLAAFATTLSKNDHCDRGGGAGCRVPASYAAAARRLPLCAPGHRPAPDALVAAPLPPASRHKPPAGRRGRQAEDRLQGLSFHIDIAEAHTEAGRLYLLVAIDRTSKFAFAELHEHITRRMAGDFLRRLTAAVPYRIHAVLTDNGTHFTDPAPAVAGRQPRSDSCAPRASRSVRTGSSSPCADLDIDHRLTKPNHPWTNGQVERMNRTLKEDTVRRYHYGNHDALSAHLQTSLDAYNFARRLKTPKGRTPFEFIVEKWASEPHRFSANPDHLIPGPNI